MMVKFLAGDGTNMGSWVWATPSTEISLPEFPLRALFRKTLPVAGGTLYCWLRNLEAEAFETPLIDAAKDEQQFW
ncbi:hypothetical protein CRG98_007411 [Punica granatum]|uniref:Uncharacterized protein n=1 Tax=Punica granatum TaxID=22663 RepID=A0A2I0KV36_PUNGR|nr:hypothetical protein CRG98_007411 [Punica granatum]